ncbi:hypothetical protein JCM8097_005676 [Rhodosporidiobolus ruineniae]
MASLETEEVLVPALQHQRYLEPAVLLASSCSAISSRVTCHPLDTIRIRVQTAGAVVPPLRELIPKPRLKTLYAGLPVAVGFAVPALSIYLTTYEASKRYFGEKWLPQDREASIWQQLPIFVAAGTAAELASGAIWTPLDVLKSRLQKGDEGTSALRLIRKIVREEGWVGLQRGYWISTAVFIPNIGVYWSIYESLKQRFVPGYSSYRPRSASPPTPSAASSSLHPSADSPSAPPPSSAPPSLSSSPLDLIPTTLRYTLCSVLACAVAATTTTPIEVIQARWQTSGGRVAGGVGGVVRELWRQGGVRAFGRGLGVRIAYAIPANGISMTVYESIKRQYGLD